jgi:uncharacterized protein
MTTELRRRSQNQLLVARLTIASTLWARTKGLLGRADLADDEGLLIERCNSVHTFFMNFPLDLIFVDRNMVVRRTIHHVKANRLVWPVFSARKVIEVKSGFLMACPVHEGEELYVAHSLS